MHRHLTLRNLLLCFLAGSALVLVVEDLLQTYAASTLCPTTACAIVGGYVRFGEAMLRVVGAVYLSLLWALLFFAGRYDKMWLWGGLTVALMGGLAFDGALLGFQFMTLEEFCLICVGVAAVLFLTLLGYSFLRKSLLIGVLGIAVWSAGFLANTVLTPPKPTPAIDRTVLFKRPADNNATVRYHLFFSLHCPACSELLLNLSVNNPREVNWHFSALDDGKADRMRLTHIVQSERLQKNPFLEILHYEVAKDLQDVPVPQEVRQAVEKAQTYFVNGRFQNIPLLIVRERAGKSIVLKGAREIIDFLVEEGLLHRLNIKGAGGYRTIELPSRKEERLEVSGGKRNGASGAE